MINAGNEMKFACAQPKLEAVGYRRCACVNGQKCTLCVAMCTCVCRQEEGGVLACGAVGCLPTAASRCFRGLALCQWRLLQQLHLLAFPPSISINAP